MRPTPPPDRSASSRTASGWSKATSHLQTYGTTESSSTPTPPAYNSVAGLMLDTLGHLPRPGERVTTNEFSLTVEAVRENRIDLVRISRDAAPPDAPTA